MPKPSSSDSKPTKKTAAQPPAPASKKTEPTAADKRATRRFPSTRRRRPF